MRSKDKNRFDRANNRFPSFYDAYGMSEALLNQVREAGAIGVFEQPLDKIAAWIKKQPAPLKDEMLFLGLARAVSRVRTVTKYGRVGAANLNKRKNVVHSVRVEKARAFDRIVEMLDHLDVNGKVLGDCTRADLLRAAVQLEQQAEDAKVRAALYRQLADIVGNSTVREASGRGQIVALLTTTFKEAA